MSFQDVGSVCQRDDDIGGFAREVTKQLEHLTTLSDEFSRRLKQAEAHLARIDEKLEFLDRHDHDATFQCQELRLHLNETASFLNVSVRRLESLEDWVERHHPRSNNCPRCGAKIRRADGKCGVCPSNAA